MVPTSSPTTQAIARTRDLAAVGEQLGPGVAKDGQLLIGE